MADSSEGGHGSGAARRSWIRHSRAALRDRETPAVAGYVVCAGRCARPAMRGQLPAHRDPSRLGAAFGDRLGNRALGRAALAQRREVEFSRPSARRSWRRRSRRAAFTARRDHDARRQCRAGAGRGRPPDLSQRRRRTWRRGSSPPLVAARPRGARPREVSDGLSTTTRSASSKSTRTGRSPCGASAAARIAMTSTGVGRLHAIPFAGRSSVHSHRATGDPFAPSRRERPAAAHRGIHIEALFAPAGTTSFNRCIVPDSRMRATPLVMGRRPQ